MSKWRLLVAASVLFVGLILKLHSYSVAFRSEQLFAKLGNMAFYLFIFGNILPATNYVHPAECVKMSNRCFRY